jgi:hypothetical protein
MLTKNNILLVLLFCTYGTYAGQIKSRVEVFYVEEVSGGESFIYRIDAIDGKKRESWSINGTSVDRVEYSQRLMQADMLEQQRLREVERDRQLAKMEEAHELRILLSKKLVRIALADIDREYSKLADVRLLPYRLYGRTTFANEETLRECMESVVVRARKLLELPIDSSWQGAQHKSCEDIDVDCPEPQDEAVQELVSVELLTATANELSELPEKLEGLYRATIKNAVATCDDTKLLKELLSLI